MRLSGVVWALGIDIIFDVEKEKTLYIEECHEGGIEFLQWQQSKDEKLKRKEAL